MIGGLFSDSTWTRRPSTASRVAAAGLLGAALATDGAGLGWRRGYLPGIVALMALVVVTQIVTAMGAGPFVFAAPALWMGMGGPAAASKVSMIQLLLPLPVARWPSSRRSAGGGAPGRAER